MAKDVANTSNSAASDKGPSLSDQFTLDAAAKSIAEKPITYERRAPDSDRLAYRRIHSEEVAFRTIDTHLAALHKDLKNYQRRYKETLEAFGDDDPMLDIIADQVDSARSAYETRLIEIKRDHGIVAAGLSLYKNAREQYLDEQEFKQQEELEAQMLEKWKRLALFLKSIADTKKKKEKQGLDAAWLLILALFYKPKPDYSLLMTQQRI